MMAMTLLAVETARAGAGDYFEIQVVDSETGRGVPLVELSTVNHAAWWTDSAGRVAFNEPGLMGLEVYFHVRSPGYEFPEDGFHNRGVKLKPVAGGKSVIQLKRLNIAERLYRVTGQGIYRDTVLLGHPAPLQNPTLNGQVFGQDTVVAAPYRGRLYWFWGDTDRPSYPLGNFGVSGAVSEIPGRGGLDPGVGVDLSYFVDASGFAKAMCPNPGTGLRWLEGLMVVRDGHGGDCLVARMTEQKDVGEAQAWYLMKFNDEQKIFEPLHRWDFHESHRSAHPFRARIDGSPYYYIDPDFRVPADLAALADSNRYEIFTCAAGDGKWRGASTEVDRDAEGRPRYEWKAAGELKPGQMNRLVRAGKLKPEERWDYLLDVETGAPLMRGLECVAWNPFHQRWIAFLADRPGEAWFAESDTPTGPWGYARRVVTHGDYNFYNLAHHPFFDQDGGRLVYFEGTYTAAFSNAKTQTPRYDYNQLMYRLDLNDPRLDLPVAVYRVRGNDGQIRLKTRPGHRSRERLAAGRGGRMVCAAAHEWDSGGGSGIRGRKRIGDTALAYAAAARVAAACFWDCHWLKSPPRIRRRPW